MGFSIFTKGFFHEPMVFHPSIFNQPFMIMWEDYVKSNFRYIALWSLWHYMWSCSSYNPPTLSNKAGWKCWGGIPLVLFPNWCTFIFWQVWYIVRIRMSKQGLKRFGFTSLETSKKSEGGIPAKKKQKTANRNYDKQLHSTWILKSGNDNAPIPLCVICGETLPNSGTKPHNLKRQLEQRHAYLKDKPIEYYQQLKSATKTQ